MAWSYRADGCVWFFKSLVAGNYLADNINIYLDHFHLTMLLFIHALVADFHFYIQGSSPFLGKQNSRSLFRSLFLSLFLYMLLRRKSNLFLWICIDTTGKILFFFSFITHKPVLCAVIKGEVTDRRPGHYGGSILCSRVPQQLSYYHHAEVRIGFRLRLV